MNGLDDDTDAARLEYFLDGARYLLGETLLHLEAAGEDLDDAWQLGQPDDLAVRDVANVHLAEERQHVVLAHAVHLDIAHENHVGMILGEHSVTDDVGCG